MSIITIQLDTTKGDTLQGALRALMTSSRLEYPNYPEPKATNETNPFRSNGETVGVGDKVVLPVNATERISEPSKIDPTGKFPEPSTLETFTGSVTTQGPGYEADWPKSSLGPMDGDRKRGEPGVGHRRRTNAQIAEDEVYFKQRGHAAVSTMEMGTEAPETRGTASNPLSPKSDAATTQPSNESVGESLTSKPNTVTVQNPGSGWKDDGLRFGEAKTNPDDEPTPEEYAADNARAAAEAAQDAADEAAESAAKRGGEATLDDLRKVIGEYQKKFGMAQAAAKSLEYNGGQPIFEVPSKDIPMTIMRWKAAIEHDKPGEAAKFTPVKTESGVVQGTSDRKFIHESTAKSFNPESGNPVAVVHTRPATREEVNATIVEGKNYTQAHAVPVVATREQVNAAINDYATKFDGSLEPAKMVNTKADIPKLMERLFGAGKNNFNSIERTAENYGRVIAAIQAEIGKNTFGRTVK